MMDWVMSRNEDSSHRWHVRELDALDTRTNPNHYIVDSGKCGYPSDYYLTVVDETERQVKRGGKILAKIGETKSAFENGTTL